jgi:hypothetical protein
VFQWHVRFKTGSTSVDDNEHTGRPTSCTTPETVTRIQELVRQDRRYTIPDIVEEVRIGYGTYQRVMTKEFGMHRVTDKFVPKVLRADQRQQRVNVFTELRQLASDDETPDLAHCDFFLFPYMKLKLKGRRFDTIEEIQIETTECLTL